MLLQICMPAGCFDIIIYVICYSEFSFSQQYLHMSAIPFKNNYKYTRKLGSGEVSVNIEDHVVWCDGFASARYDMVYIIRVGQPNRSVHNFGWAGHINSYIH